MWVGQTSQEWEQELRWLLSKRSQPLALKHIITMCEILIRDVVKETAIGPTDVINVLCHRDYDGKFECASVLKSRGRKALSKLHSMTWRSRGALLSLDVRAHILYYTGRHYFPFNWTVFYLAQAHWTLPRINFLHGFHICVAFKVALPICNTWRRTHKACITSIFSRSKQ